jgi:hypothetical protein
MTINSDGRMCIDELERLAYVNGWRLIRPEHMRKVLQSVSLTEAELRDLVTGTPRGPGVR